LTLSMSIPALVIENKRGSEALSRSWALIMSAFGHSLGTLALTFLVLIAGSIAAGVVGTAGETMYVIANLALQVITLPFVSLVLVLLYVNLRVKAGGITKDSLRAELRATGPTAMP
jgi:membrane protein implicated in regulation of membrane protease activity